METPGTLKMAVEILGGRFCHFWESGYFTENYLIQGCSNQVLLGAVYAFGAKKIMGCVFLGAFQNAIFYKIICRTTF